MSHRELKEEKRPPETITAVLEMNAQRFRMRPALLAPGRQPLSYGALAARVRAAREQLRTLGIGPGDRIALVLPNGPAAAVAFLAAAGIGAAAPLNPAYQAAEFEFYLDDLDARAVITVAGDRSAVRDVAGQLGIPVVELDGRGDAAGEFTLQLSGTAVTAAHPAGDGHRSGPVEVTAADVALVLHTSGTTARPKIVPLTHANIAASAAHIRQTLQLTPADRCLNVMPLFHIHGLMAALMASLTAGGSVACTPGFLAPRFFGWLEEFSPTWYTAVPTIHQAVLSRAAGSAGVIANTPLRFIRSSSASLAPSVMAEVEATFGVPVVEAYGMTEAAHQMTSNPLPPGARKPGSVGPAAGPEVAIMDEVSPRLLAPGETGEVVIRGPNVTGGYANNPAANAAAFVRGWFRTGDQGYLDEDGYLTLTGRLKELINRGGEKIAPREVDEALLAHPAVRQAVAFAIPNPLLGEEVGAAVVLDDSAVAPDVLRQHVAERIAPFKVPHQLVFVDAIPKGPTGKLQRIGLAERLGVTAREGVSGGQKTPYVAPEGEVEEALAAKWADVLGVSTVGATQPFLDSGGDSMTAAQLVTRIRERFELPFGVAELLAAPTVREQAKVVAALGQGVGNGKRAVDSLRQLKDRPGEMAALYLVPGGGGGETEFLAYARFIDALDRPVYGFYARGQDDGRERHNAVGQMVGDYLAELRAAQQHGPYILAGECIGGKVAYDMAARLEQAGETVVLVLLNTRFEAQWERPSVRGYWRSQAGLHWAALRRGNWRARWHYARKTLAASPLNVGNWANPDYARQRQRLRARVAYRALLRSYKPEGRFHQPVVYVTAQEDYDGAPPSRLGELAAGPLHLLATPGNRHDYLGRAGSELARRIEHHLRDVAGRAAARPGA